MQLFADVLTSANAWNSEQPLLTYTVPPELQNELQIGQLIAVPYGDRLVEGIVWSIWEDDGAGQQEDEQQMTGRPRGSPLHFSQPTEDNQNVGATLAVARPNVARPDYAGRGQAPPLHYTNHESPPEYSRGDPRGRPENGRPDVIRPISTILDLKRRNRA